MVWGLICAAAILFFFAGWRVALAQSPSSPVIVLPGQTSPVKLQTHTSDITLDGAGSASVSAFYRLRNDTAQTTLLPILFTMPSAANPAALPGDLYVTAGGEALSLQPVASGMQAVVSVPANGRLDLRMTYSLGLDGDVVEEVAYPAHALDAWPGDTSFRLTVNTPASIPNESWLRIAPEGWRFGTTDGEVATALQWLYEGNLPTDPITFAYVAPSLWQEISQRRSAATISGSPQDYVALGESYAKLTGDQVDQGVRDRYYGQALAAYSTALSHGAAAGLGPADLAAAYAGQAALYRIRILNAGGVVSPEHAQLLVESVAKALDGLPAGDPQRAELQQWFNDGLAIVLGHARDQRDWTTALSTLDLLAAAGNGIDQAKIEEERKRILFEQSLQLLEEGQRGEAVALSGSAIVGEELQPPNAARALFTSWQSTMTVDSRGTDVTFAGTPAQGRELDAATAAGSVSTAVADAASSFGGEVKLKTPAAESPGGPVEIAIHVPSGASTTALATVIPLSADWSLLRALLSQIAPVTETEGGFLRRNILLRQNLDLREAGEAWQRLASELNAGAETLEARDEPANRDEAASLEAALRTKIQAANYRAEANHWSNLVENSQLVVLLEGPRGAPTDARAWQLTVQDPPQTLQYATWGLNQTAVLGVVAALIAVLLLVAAILWSLL